MDLTKSVPAKNQNKRSNTQSKYFENQDMPLPKMKKSTTLKSVVSTLEIKNFLRLDQSFFDQPCISLAKNLLGKVLVRKLTSGEILRGKIVETESYLGTIDKASHSYNGKITERNEAMFLKPGTAYVYSIYGMYFCFNISSSEEGSAVLLRALEPLEGESTMKNYRQKQKKVSETKTKDLCNGPSKLCQSFNIDKTLNKVDLVTSDSLWLEEGIDLDLSNIISCKRIGIDSYGEEWGNKPLRFYVKNNCFVSRRNKGAEKLHDEKFVNMR